MTWTKESRDKWLAQPGNEEKRKAWVKESNKKNRKKITEQTNEARKRASAQDPVGYWRQQSVAEARRRDRRAGREPDANLRGIDCPTECPVLGLVLDYSRWTGKTGYNWNSPSLDRLDPRIGYTLANTRVISNRANTLKRDGTAAELRAVVAYIEKELGR